MTTTLSEDEAGLFPDETFKLERMRKETALAREPAPTPNLFQLDLPTFLHGHEVIAFPACQVISAEANLETGLVDLVVRTRSHEALLSLHPYTLESLNYFLNLRLLAVPVSGKNEDDSPSNDLPDTLTIHELGESNVFKAIPRANNLLCLFHISDRQLLAIRCDLEPDQVGRLARLLAKESQELQEKLGKPTAQPLVSSENESFLPPLDQNQFSSTKLVGPLFEFLSFHRLIDGNNQTVSFFRSLHSSKYHAQLFDAFLRSHTSPLSKEWHASMAPTSSTKTLGFVLVGGAAVAGLWWWTRPSKKKQVSAGTPIKIVPPGTVTPPGPIKIVPATENPPGITGPWPKLPADIENAPEASSPGNDTMPWLRRDRWDRAVSKLAFSDVWAPPGYLLYAVNPDGTKPADYDNWRFAFDWKGAKATGLVPQVFLDSPALCGNHVTTAQKVVEQGGEGLLPYYTSPYLFIERWADKGYMVMGWRTLLCNPFVSNWAEFQLFAVSPDQFRYFKDIGHGLVIISMPYGYSSTRAIWENYSSAWKDNA